MASDKHLSFKCFPKNAFVSKIFSKSSGHFGHSECKWVKTRNRAPQLRTGPNAVVNLLTALE